MSIKSLIDYNYKRKSDFSEDGDEDLSFYAVYVIGFIIVVKHNQLLCEVDKRNPIFELILKNDSGLVFCLSIFIFNNNLYKKFL